LAPFHAQTKHIVHNYYKLKELYLLKAAKTNLVFFSSIPKDTVSRKKNTPRQIFLKKAIALIPLPVKPDCTQPPSEC
jgi:hypothetical protein